MSVWTIFIHGSLNSFVAGAVYDAAGFRTGVGASFENLCAVDKNVGDTGRELVRFFVSRVRANGGGVEDDYIGIVAGLQLASFFQMKELGRHTAQLVDRIFERNEFFVADIGPEQVRKIAVGA